MALDRPADAVSSYESALQFGMRSDLRNKLYANLGQAYTSTGQMQQAVQAFEMALADKTYYLNDAASVDYQRAVGAVAQGTAVMQPVDAPASVDMSGLDVPADGAPVYHETDYEAAANSPYYYSDTYNVQDGYASGDDRFFNATEAEIEQYSKGVARQDRKRRNVGLKLLVAFIVIILLLAAAAVFAYTQGFGFPTQNAVVEQMFSNKDAAKTALFSSDLNDETIDAMLDPVVEDQAVKVDGVERSMNTSIAYVTAHTQEGGEVKYKITLSRDGVGWKIGNVELYFASEN